MGRMGVDAAIELVAGKKLSADAAPGRDADDQGQCRGLHRQASLNRHVPSACPSQYGRRCVRRPLIRSRQRHGRRRRLRRRTATPFSNCAGSARNTAPITVLAGRQSRRAQGRGSRAARRERRRQVDACRHRRGARAPTAGAMTWRGQPYAPPSPADALSAGIGLIHQEMRLLKDLSIAENVFVGRLPTAVRQDRPGDDEPARRRTAASSRPRRAADHAGRRDLRVAAQQQVEIAKALTLDAKLADLRRTDRRSGRRRDGASVRADRAAEARRRQLHLYQPSPRRDRAHRRSRRGAARRPIGGDPRHRAGAGEDAGRGNGRPAARPHVPADPRRRTARR